MLSSSISLAATKDIGGSSKQQDFVRTSAFQAVLCDGHGPKGHDIAEAVCEFQMRTGGDPASLFQKTDEYLREHYGPDKVSGIGGTTCSNLTFDPSTRVMTVASIGDSSVRYWDTGGEGVEASVNHSPSTYSEYVRVQEAGGVFSFHDISERYSKGKQPIFVDGKYNKAGGYYFKNCKRDEYSVYFENPLSEEEELYGPFTKRSRLAVTRAFADWPLVPYGLIAEPSVNIVPPPSEGTRAVVMASDGLWDVMFDEAIGAIVRRPEFLLSRDAEAASQELMRVALMAGRSLFGACSDNVSIVVAYV